MKKLAASVLMLAVGVGCTSQAHKTLQEDDSGWDCHTMGNRVCGDQVEQFNAEMKAKGFAVIYPQVAGVCETMRNGGSLFAAAGIVSDFTDLTDPHQIGEVVGVTVKIFCPEVAGQ